MKQRLLTAAIGISLLLLILAFFDTVIFHIAIALVAGLSVFEVLQASGCTKHKMLSACGIAFSVLVPFFRTPGFNIVSRIAILLYIFAVFAIMLQQHATLRFEKVAVIFLVSILVPFSFSSLIYVRDQFPRDGLFFILLMFAGAWFTDAGGYFIGRFFGKHKMCPTISPKKTVEGAVGGILFSVFFYLVMGVIYYWVQQALGVTVRIHYLTMALVAPVIAVVAMFGDLVASMIKRQCGVKDFGKIFPGHGGMMDRFDSVLFVAPFLYVFLQLFPLVS